MTDFLSFLSEFIETLLTDLKLSMSSIKLLRLSLISFKLAQLLKFQSLTERVLERVVFSPGRVID